MQLSRSDPTIKAGINLDGDLSGDDSTSQLSQPFLNITSGNLLKSETEIDKATAEKFNRIHVNSYGLVLHNAAHMDFSSYDLFDWGGPPAETQLPVRDVTNKHVVAFFQTHLKGQSSELFNEKTICKVIKAYDSSV